MTVVAYRSGQMAADSSCFCGVTNVHGVKKIWRVGGGLVGCCGALSDIMMFVRWLRDGAADGEYPQMRCMEAIVVDPRGRVCSYEHASSEPIVVEGRYCAVGAGAEIALGAMHAGADARAAVRAAIRHSGQVMPPVRSYQLRSKGDKQCGR